MDLVGKSLQPASVRGGRGDFKWENIKDDKHKSNYLGNSMMVPGKWQKGNDPVWYAKGSSDSSNKDIKEEHERAIELRKIKLAEEAAMAAALGFEIKTDSISNPDTNAISHRSRVSSSSRSHRREHEHSHRHKRRHRNRDEAKGEESRINKERNTYKSRSSGSRNDGSASVEKKRAIYDRRT